MKFINPHTGKGKIGVLIEDHFDGQEFSEFNAYFPKQGYQVEYLTHLWGQQTLTFGSNPAKDSIEHHVTVDKEIAWADPLAYRGILLIGAYAMDRLRYEKHPKKGSPNQAPAVQFLRKALKVKGLKIGTVCHGLWLFCADPELLKGKKVTCAHNIISDVENAGGDVQFNKSGTLPVCIDGNLISCDHPQNLGSFMDTFIKEMEKEYAHYP